MKAAFLLSVFIVGFTQFGFAQGTDYGDLPDTANGTAPGTLFSLTRPDYKTRAADGGPSHVIVSGLNFRNNTGSGDAHVDPENDAFQSPDANGDNFGGENDELGLSLNVTQQQFVPDGTHSFFNVEILASAAVTNVLGTDARVYGFIDLNSDGDFDDPDETAPVTVVPGDGSVTSVNVLFKFKLTGIHPVLKPERHYAMRFRISTDANLDAHGPATNGEVMDSIFSHQFDVPGGGYALLDYGDLEAALYPVQYAANGARHSVRSSLFLGSTLPDGEVDGLGSILADGDDTSASDDEDSITPTSFFPIRGFATNLPVTVTNNSGVAAMLTGFIDWNKDGDFADPGEVSSKSVPHGTTAESVPLLWNVPLGAVHSAPLPARLRLTTDGVVPPSGRASDGEVEDFLVTVPEVGYDFGDLPDEATGTGPGVFGTISPPDYRTSLADGGPSHIMRPGLFLAYEPLLFDGVGAAHVDHENDGQPSDLANGDNLGGENDEQLITSTLLTQTFTADGIHSYFTHQLHISHAISNTTGDVAQMTGFLDVNNDGDFDDPGEQTRIGYIVFPGPPAPTTLDFPGTTPYAAGGPIFTWNYNLTEFPAGTTEKTLAVRTRLTTDPSIGPGGPASDGEVQDDLVTFSIARDPIDAETMMDYGDLNPGRYPTLWESNGARHYIRPTLFIGTTVDGEPMGPGGTIATGDDLAGSDDEDGFIPASVLVRRGAAVSFPVVVNNSTTNAATLRGFADWNDDGDFDDLDESASVPVPAGSTGATVLLPWNIPATASTTAPVAVRLRLSHNPTLGPAGIAPEGEVEDYLVRVLDPAQLDFGDLPDGPYRTLAANNGAAHAVSPDLYLGSTQPDSEADGNHTPGATGDDANGADDEDAITPATFFPVRGFSINLPVNATNTTGGGATLTGFIDWNNDGDFADAGETSSNPVPDGSTGATIRLLWNVPLTAVHTLPLAARLRLTTDGAVPPFGGASDGEVEDFRVSVREVGYDWADLPDAVPGTASGTHGTATPPDYRTTSADGGPSHIMRPGLFLAYDPLLLTGEGAAHLDHENDGQPGDLANGDNLGGENDEQKITAYYSSLGFTADGIHSYFTLQLLLNHTISNTTGDVAQMTGFLDVNNDGDFDDPGEKTRIGIFNFSGASIGGPETTIGTLDIPGTTPRLKAGPYFTWNYNLTEFPAGSTTKTIAVRTRLSTDPDIGPGGPASDGEVQDDLIPLILERDPIDAETMMDYGDLDNARYPTLWANNGARHIITPGLLIGASVDGEPEGAAGAGATGDDSAGTDDEDGFNPAGINALLGFPVVFPVTVTNTTATGKTLSAFVDWNDDGDFADAFETSSAVVAPGTASGVVELSFIVPPTASTTAPLAVRLRLHDGTSIGPMGHGGAGEVEDYVITAQQGIDFGDLPDTAAGTAAGVVTDLSTISQGDYRTRLADNGARHFMRPDLVLYDDTFGSLVHIDAEADGNPSADADGDNLNGDDDERIAQFAVMRSVFDPMTTQLTFTMFGSIAAKNETGAPAFIHAFMDMNNDGDFADAGEKAVRDLNGDGDTADAGEAATLVVPSAPGAAVHTMTFTRTVQLSETNYIPSWTLRMPVRFRLSSVTSLGPDGPAPDGEVEDYMVSITISTSDYRPRAIDGARPFDFLVDRNTPARLDAFKVVPPNYISVNAFKWHFGNNQTPGTELLLLPSEMSALPNGLHPYSVNVQFFPGHLGSHTGFIAIRDMADFRTVMDGEGVTDETSAPEADLDGDGVSNFTEYALGSDPGTPGDAAKLLVFTAPNIGGGTDFTMAYLRRIGGTQTGARYETPDIIYQSESSDELTDWSKPLIHVTPPPALPPPPVGYEWGAVRRTVLGGKGFGKLGTFAR